MTSLIMDPPHVVHTGVACMACCAVAPGKLLRCGGCNSAWYCNQDCQRKNFKEHKPFCKALRLFNALRADLPPESWPRTARDFYVQRTNCQQILQPMLRRPLSRFELRAILGEAKCSVCMRTRSQLARCAAEPAQPSVTVTSSPPTLPQPPAGFKPAAASTGPGTKAGACSSSSINNSRSTGPAPAGAKGPVAEATEMATDPAGTAPATSTAPGPGAVTRPDNPTSATTTTTSASAASAQLQCCPHCNWGWACSEHRDAYLASPHAAVCLSYQHMNDSQLLTHRYLTATGRLPNYVPDKLRPAGPAGLTRGSLGSSAAAATTAVAPWEPVPAGWAAFQGWRPLPAFDQATMCMLTQRMSQALTVVQALQHHYTPRQLAARRRLEVHVLGAGAFEVPADRIWEEILNLLPPWDPNEAAAASAETAAEGGTGGGSVAAATSGAAGAIGSSDAAAAAAGGGGGPRVLHVAFVGPELCDIIIEESDGRALPQGTSLAAPPPPPGRELLYSYHLCTYQEFVRGRKTRRDGGGGAAAAAAGGGKECVWRRPDLAVAFNSGLSEADQELWAPALETLVRHRVPVVFTSYNGEEAASDAAVWRAAGGAVTLGPERNPFRALEPISEPSQVDTFYYQNYYWWCGRAAGAPPER